MSQIEKVRELELTLHPDRDRVVIEVAGEIDIATIGRLEGAVNDLYQSGWRDVVVDLRPIEFLDSTGLCWLVSATHDARSKGRTLSLIDGSPIVARLLELTGLRSQFTWATRR